MWSSLSTRVELSQNITHCSEGMVNEYGFVSLNGLEKARGPIGMKIERDIYFRKKKMSET